MTNDKLTADRIEAAIPEVTRIRDAIYHRRSSLHLETALAALELAEQLRWRKPEEADGGSSRIVIVARRNGKTGRIRYAERTEGLIKFSYNVVGFIRIPEWEAQHGQD